MPSMYSAALAEMTRAKLFEFNNENEDNSSNILRDKHLLFRRVLSIYALVYMVIVA